MHPRIDRRSPGRSRHALSAAWPDSSTGRGGTVLGALEPSGARSLSPRPATRSIAGPEKHHMHPLVEHTGLDPALPIHPLMGGAGAREWDLAPARDLLLMASPRPRARWPRSPRGGPLLPRLLSELRSTRGKHRCTCSPPTALRQARSVLLQATPRGVLWWTRSLRTTRRLEPTRSHRGAAWCKDVPWARPFLTSS